MVPAPPIFLKTAVLALPLIALLVWADQTVPQAGVWALLLLSVSVGFVHGALDVVLLPQRFVSLRLAALMFVAYLLLVLLLGWLLGAAISLALWVLLLMSAWHFGEPYGRWDGLVPWKSGLTRAVVGGASVMLPVLLAPDQLAMLLRDVVPAAGMRGWHVMAWLWLGLLAAWLLAGGMRYPRTLRYAWFELIGCLALYMLFSPLMAFALYFGVYHAPVHIWRVWRAWLASSNSGSHLSTRVVVSAVGMTTVLTWLLGAGLWWFLTPGFVADMNLSAALQWLIVAFAALTAPHLVLISLCAAFLTRPNTSR